MYACLYAPGRCDRRDLLACAGAFSPRVEAGDDHAVIDLRGMGALFGAPEALAHRIRERAAAMGLKASVAVAANPHTASAAARGFPGVTVVAPGDEARALAPLPITLLAPGDELRETLAAWGVRTFGDLSRLPECGIADRLGAEGLNLHRLARGLAPRPLTESKDAPLYDASLELDYPLESLEPLAFVLSRLLHEICGALAQASLASNEMRLDLALDDRTVFTRVLRLPFATREPGTFLRLLQHDLAAHPPAAAITRVTLRAEPVDPRVVQNGLFLPAAPEPEKLELTLARIGAIVGEENAGTPEMIDTHRPGAFRMVRFQSSAREPEGARECSPTLAIRRFRPPLPAAVTAGPGGHPARLRARGVQGTVVACGGPWRTSGDWWTESPWARDEWDIELDTGELYRIYRESAGWFVDGNYD